MKLIDVRKIPIGTEIAVDRHRRPAEAKDDINRWQHAEKRILVYVHQRGTPSISRSKRYEGEFDYELQSGGGLIGLAELERGRWVPTACFPGEIIGPWKDVQKKLDKQKLDEEKFKHERDVEKGKFQMELDWLLNRYKAHGLTMSSKDRPMAKDSTGWADNFKLTYRELERVINKLDELREPHWVQMTLNMRILISRKAQRERRQMSDAVESRGKVVKLLPNATFRIELDDMKDPTGAPSVVLGHLSGNMRRNFIRLALGDRVKIELSPYDLTKGRITTRE